MFGKKHKLKKYGWVRGLPETGYLRYTTTPQRADLPPIVDHRLMCPPAYTQGELGSCTANAALASVQFEQVQNGIEPTYMPSRLFQYYNTRKLEGNENIDSGATITGTFRALALWGFCPESMWNYDISKFTKSPPPATYEYAQRNMIPYTHYMKVEQTEYNIKECLADGNCIVFGFCLYSSFESEQVARTGVVPLPNTQIEQCKGGHAVLLVGYDDLKRHWIVRNSWGAQWGDQGYCYFPYEYLLNPDMAADFWCLKTLTKPTTTNTQIQPS